MESLWQRTAELPHFDRLEREVRTDVLIIGGGMAGILCAHQLRQAGVDCVLLERDRLGCGVSRCTTAKITSQHGLIYDPLLRRFGAEAAGLYLRANEEAVQTYREWCAHIDCQFEEKDNFVYSLHRGDKIERELAALRTLGFPARQSDSLPLPFPAADAICFPRQAQFHPLQFLSAIVPGLRIYERSPVRELIGRTAVTDRGRVQAKRIIVATHFPFLNKHGLYFIKLYQHRSYVLALENAPRLNGMYVDAAHTGLSFRSAGNLLLLGGGGHRTGKWGGAWRELREFAARCYPEAREVCRWAAQDCMSLDGVPYIGRYSANTEHLYVATGFNKWGMTSSMAAATLLTELMQGKRSPYEALFSPSRSLLRPQLAVNGAAAMIHLLTPTAPRCPHLGCALKWNAAERTWDCPCHGSRFAEDGTLLDNPATGDLNVR